MSKEKQKAKNQLRLQNWAAEAEACSESGLTVQQWCALNGINVKTYYYHLKRIREAVLETEPSIVPICNKQNFSGKIEIYDGELRITLPDNTNAEMLATVIRVLKNA